MTHEEFNVVTRPVLQGELEALIAFDSAYLVNGAGLTATDAPPALTMKELIDARERGDEMLWLMSADEIIGYYWTETREDALFLAGIVIAVAFQNKGIGRKVLGWLDENARVKGFSKCSLAVAPANASALHLYLSHGYKVVEDKPDYFGALCPGKRRFMMEKEVQSR